MASDIASKSERSQGLLGKILDVRPDEIATLAWSALYIFAVLSAYYVIRPIRDDMGAQSGVENLSWLFAGTLIAMIAVNPPFAALVRRLPRKQFISWTYHFFAANLLVFILLMSLSSEAQGVWVGRVFFVWVSVFNLFVVSVFWALMVDVFDSEQGKRLFGFLAAGASVGAIAGSSVIVVAAKHIAPAYLLLGSAVLLEVAVLAVWQLSALSEKLKQTGQGASEDAVIGGSIFAGFTHTLRSPYLMSISLNMLLFAVTSTFLYFQQIQISVETFGNNRAARTEFFGQIDLAVNVLTFVIQIFLTGRSLKWLGVAVTLALIPALSVFGFTALALAPTIAALVALQVMRRVGNFALMRPTRELLYTVVSREDKYKSKNFIDTAVYRFGDQVGSWAYTGLLWIGLGMAGIAWVAVPLSMLWLVNSWWLGRTQERAAQTAEPS